MSVNKQQTTTRLYNDDPDYKISKTKYNTELRNWGKYIHRIEYVFNSVMWFSSTIFLI